MTNSNSDSKNIAISSRPFQGKTVLITGGTRGIGKSIALEFATLGADIALNYLSDDKSAFESKKELEKIGAKVALFKANATDENQVKKMFQDVVDEFGKIDVLVNNADDGRFEFAEPMKIKSEDWMLMFQGSCMTVMFGCKHILPHFRERNCGRIINIAAAGSDQVDISSLCLPYYIAKQGVISLTKVLAVSEARYNITVNAISPAYVENYGYPASLRKKLLKRIPMKRFAKTEEIAKAASFLASDDAQYYSGINIIVGGGYG